MVGGRDNRKMPKAGIIPHFQTIPFFLGILSPIPILFVRASNRLSVVAKRRGWLQFDVGNTSSSSCEASLYEDTPLNIQSTIAVYPGATYDGAPFASTANGGVAFAGVAYDSATSVTSLVYSSPFIPTKVRPADSALRIAMNLKTQELGLVEKF
jgi:hypothetical protein